MVSLLSDKHIVNAVNSNIDYIKTETLSDEISILNDLDKGVDIEFDDVNTKPFIEKI